MPVETRYMRSNQANVNGLNCFVLGAVQSAAIKGSSVFEGSLVGIRVWKRASGGAETEITAGVPVAQVTVPLVSSYVNNTWNCPLTALNATDTVVVRVYCDQTGAWALLLTDEIPPKNCEYQTEQLGASSLDAALWTVHYRFTLIVGVMNFRFGAAAANSRIENFTWTLIVVEPLMDGFMYIE